eukprot:TRINITY_DN29714_c0_g1_i1.p1 TRINITY_DN29714_c0_g1~~TRINITY_DN29714_c0_g1_i1.p1  ORF type:complete len:644 (+),score=117.62 TRINITY_DN29714_c0_g1_i1:62-1993(+)
MRESLCLVILVLLAHSWAGPAKGGKTQTPSQQSTAPSPAPTQAPSLQPSFSPIVPSPLVDTSSFKCLLALSDIDPSIQLSNLATESEFNAAVQSLVQAGQLTSNSYESFYLKSYTNDANTCWGVIVDDSACAQYVTQQGRYKTTTKSTFSKGGDDCVGDGFDCPSDNFNYGLDRMNQRDLPLDSNVNSRTIGTGGIAYLIDTGVDSTHPELQGKVLPGRNFVNTSASTMDDNGHGTALAGLIVSNSYGIAPGANVVPLKVLDADGQGYAADVVRALLWAHSDLVSRSASASSSTAIINLSLKASYTINVLDSCIHAFYQSFSGQGDYRAQTAMFTCTAGNDGVTYTNANDLPSPHHACLYTSASDINDNLWSMSNFIPFNLTGTAYGSGTLGRNYILPGVNIRTLWPDGRTAVVNGTSFSTAIFTGLLLAVADISRKFLSTNPTEANLLTFLEYADFKTIEITSSVAATLYFPVLIPQVFSGATGLGLLNDTAESSICKGMNQQCGGSGYLGITCCQDGLSCTSLNSTYRSCLVRSVNIIPIPIGCETRTQLSVNMLSFNAPTLRNYAGIVSNVQVKDCGGQVTISYWSDAGAFGKGQFDSVSAPYSFNITTSVQATQFRVFVRLVGIGVSSCFVSAKFVFNY